MRFTSRTSSDGVTEEFFTLDEIPGVLWTPDDAHGTRPLILLGHGGGQHKAAPGTVARARRYAAEGFAVVAIDAPHHGDRPKDEEFGRITAELRTAMAAGGNPGALVAGMHGHLAGRAVADWRAVLTAVQRLDRVGVGPVGYCGLSMGCGLGVPLIAAEPRIRAAVLGLLGVHGLAEDAARITVPVQFLIQWDDQMVARDQSLALFDALASAEKTLHANPGRHGDVPSFEVDGSVRFFARHLG
ncbi:dienelactone hydrolase family protein [Streptomyces sp. AV19]|uniref:dienelactone hydrolase family protein n=1 Tax=Streptomyces sp. AV19 TaxID=2793068 RepID=UPI0018FE3840|nr:dienelactone hydrolase family protein [Streptomyces sp. AV19]MBH1937706.1 dienelactone hydrolase family protein [Streptomyces sp. AV19]MDG4536374.1 dienelactone hydrolase family protein [Streptomyces sp. AV19]